ncbi:MAG: RDD family protein [Thermoleophilaceae bacterium]
MPPAPPYGGPVPPGGWHQAPPAAGGRAQGELASWGSRAGAYAIDSLVLLVPAIILFVLLVGGAVGLTGTDDEDVAVGAAFVAFFGWLLLVGLIWLFYAPPLMSRKGERNGQTWGKQLVGIRAVRDSGEPWRFGSAALREVVLKNLAVGIASSIIPIIPWFLNFFWPLWDDQNRALHDMAASSHVVRA